MARLSELAAKAIRWLRKKIEWLDTHEEEVQMARQVLSANARIGKYVSRFFTLLEQAEATVGAHTAVWKKVAKANRSHTGIELTEGEVAYLAKFKQAFDKTIKKI